VTDIGKLKGRFTGSMVAIVTPFTEQGGVDWDAFGLLLERQIQHGTEGIIVCGTTGEAATLNDDEFMAVIGNCVEMVRNRVPVIAGTGGNNTQKVIDTSKAVEGLGVDGLLVVSPYYNKPTQGGLRRHYEAIFEAVERPVVLYNVPGRTASNIAASTTLLLAQHERCVGVKEASGDLEQIQEILFGAPDDFVVLSGDDALTFPMMALGAHGVVGVASNVIPRRMKNMVDALLEGDLATARRIQKEVLPLMKALFTESNPIPVKAALAHLGLIQDTLRLPLVSASVETRRRLGELLDGLSGDY
jgi:4-hydroxy-tetrahydrodipicolinate synthase